MVDNNDNFCPSCGATFSNSCPECGEPLPIAKSEEAFKLKDVWTKSEVLKLQKEKPKLYDTIRYRILGAMINGKIKDE